VLKRGTEVVSKGGRSSPMAIPMLFAVRLIPVAVVHSLLLK